MHNIYRYDVGTYCKYNYDENKLVLFSSPSCDQFFMSLKGIFLHRPQIAKCDFIKISPYEL